MRRRALLLATLLGLAASGAARADALDSLKAFVADVKTGRAAFTQVVTSADGAKQRRSNGSFEFSRLAVVPEPAMFALTALGAACGLQRRRCAKRGMGVSPIRNRGATLR